MDYATIEFLQELNFKINCIGFYYQRRDKNFSVLWFNKERNNICETIFMKEFIVKSFNFRIFYQIKRQCNGVELLWGFNTINCSFYLRKIDADFFLQILYYYFHLRFPDILHDYDRWQKGCVKTFSLSYLNPSGSNRNHRAVHQ